MAKSNADSDQMNNAMVNGDETPKWVNDVVARGWHNNILTTLDVVEPIAPIIAQFLTMMSPFARNIGQAGTVSDIAELLETSQGRQRMRQWLQNANEVETTD